MSMKNCLHRYKYDDTLLYESQILEVSQMARGRKNLTLDEQLDRITKEINTMEDSLIELNKAKNDLEEQIHRNQLEELDELISKSGLSIEEVKELLSKEQD